MRAGQGGGDARGEGVVGGQRLGGVAFVADLLAEQLAEVGAAVAGPPGVDVAVSGVVGVEGLAQSVRQVPPAALDRRLRPPPLRQRGDRGPAVEDDQRRGVDPFSWGPIIDQSSSTVRPSRCEPTRRRPGGPDRPVNPIARFTRPPFLLRPARPPVPSRSTTSGLVCAGPSSPSGARIAATSASAPCACPAVAPVPASARSQRAEWAKLICVESSARSTVSRSVRRLPASPSSSSNGANTRPQDRQPTCHKMISTRPAAVCSTRGRVRRPLRAKSPPARH